MAQPAESIAHIFSFLQTDILPLKACSKALPEYIQFSNPITNHLTNIDKFAYMLPNRAFNEISNKPGGYTRWWYMSIEYTEFENLKVDHESYCVRLHCDSPDELE